MFSEIELKFLITHPHPEEIWRGIEDLKQLERYVALPENKMYLRDIYLDTTERLLQKNRLALRFRTQNGNQFITIKGDKKIQEYGAVHRLEIERAWDQPSLSEIIKVLSTSIPTFKPGQFEFSANHPIQTLQGLELHPIQERTTHRTIRLLTDRLSDSLIAEGALDETIFKIANESIRHFELEIELKGKGTEQTLQLIKTAILSAYPESLEMWVISKLELGMILENVINKPVFREFLDKNNRISHRGYNYIRREYKFL
ncbi:MAG: CYTH domain-containing protein [bacterium]|nr:MAG: CYTH domain-containing protein [bacterium]